jgi:glutaredoxin
MSGRVIVYITLGCPYSTHVVQILKEEQILHEVVNITEYPLGVDTLFSLTGDKSVPHVFVNEHHLGVCVYSLWYLAL